MTLLRSQGILRSVSSFRSSIITFQRIRHLNNTTDWTAPEQGHRQVFLNNLKKQQGPGYEKREISSPLLLETLRNIQAIRSLKSASNALYDIPSTITAAEDFKAALRTIQQLVAQPGNKKKIKIGEIEKVLSPENAVSWRLIHELLKGEEIPELQNLDEETLAAMQFVRVHGIGRTYAGLFAKEGARTLEDLASATGSEYGRKISHSQKLGIKYLKDMEQLIPREEIEKFKPRIEAGLAEASPDFRYEIMGSYRRGEGMSSDIDLIVYHPEFEQRNREKAEVFKQDSLMGKLKGAMISSGLIDEDKIHTLAKVIRGKKTIAMTRLGSKGPYRQIDIRLCPNKSVPYMLVGNTGDSQLTKIVRTKAVQKSWMMNEYEMGPLERHGSLAVVQAGKEIIVKDEEGIFKRLGLSYLKPDQRSYKVYSQIEGYKRVSRKSPA